MGLDLLDAATAKVLNDDTVSPGWLGLVVFLVLAGATALLLKSFRTQVNKVPPTFDAPGDATPPGSPTASSPTPSDGPQGSQPS